MAEVYTWTITLLCYYNKEKGPHQVRPSGGG